MRREDAGEWRFGAVAVEITAKEEFDKIRKSEALLAQAEQVAHLGSWEYDELTGEVTWSDSLCRICGLDPPKTGFSNELYLQLLHPDDRDMVRSVVERGVRDRQMFEHEARYVLPGGRERILFSRGKPCCDHRGRVVKWIGISQDITERKEAERALVKNEARLRALFQISKTLTSTLQIGTILDTLICEAMELVGAEREWSALRTTRGLVCRKYFEGKNAVGIDMLWAPGECIPGRVLLDKQPYLTNTAELDPLVSPEMRERFGVRHVLCVPVLDARAEVIAVFSLNNKKEASGFTPTDLELVVGISQVASIALQNALAYRKIRRAERDLRRLSGRLLQLQDQERRHIARELHDQTAQSLGTLHVNLSAWELRTAS